MLDKNVIYKLQDIIEFTHVIINIPNELTEDLAACKTVNNFKQ